MSEETLTARSLYAKAFGAGSDARLLGTPFEFCPFLDRGEERLGWQHGWRDCHDNWGSGVDGRWRYRRLPPALAGYYPEQKQTSNIQHRTSNVEVWRSTLDVGC
jgi:hypothetical protein